MINLKINEDDLVPLLSSKFKYVTNSLASYKRNDAVKLGKCQICSKSVEKGDIDSIHKRGDDRRGIIKNIVNEIMESEGVLSYDLIKKKYREYHKENNVIAFGCKDCHKKYDEDKDFEIDKSLFVSI